MNNGLKVYIADNEKVFIREASARLSECGRIEVIGSCPDGREALNQILRLRPEAVVADLPLPGLDGLSLLKHIRRLSPRTRFVICTRFITLYSLEAACQLQVDYFMCKPADYDRLIAVLLSGREREGRRWAAEAGGGEIEARTHALLSGLGLPSRLRGMELMTRSARLLTENPQLLKNLTSGLYEALSEQTGEPVSSIERSIRNAINVAYCRGDLPRVFPQRPSNKEMLVYLLRHLEGDGEGL